VFIAAQNTGLGPEKTSFFQALSIATKISKGTIEIMADVHLIKKEERVGASEATLLNMLNISPFTYGLKIQQVYDSGTVFEPKVLDITNDDIHAKFMAGVKNLASVCLGIGYPTIVSAPHSMINGFKNLLAVALETSISFKEAEMAKEYLKDPSKFAALAAEAEPEVATKAAEKPKEKAKVEEKEESEDDDMGFGLFD